MGAKTRRTFKINLQTGKWIERMGGVDGKILYWDRTDPQTIIDLIAEYSKKEEKECQ